MNAIQGELFPPDVVIIPTISMKSGETFVTMCSWCGTLVCTSRRVKLGPCPSCDSPRAHWWLTELPVGPFHKAAAS